MPKVHVLHEVLWHDFALLHKIRNLSGDQYARGLDYVDKRYAESVSAIIDTVKAKNIVDDIFVLSDHGPRLLLSKGQTRPIQGIQPTGNKRVLRNYYGFFVYYLPVKPAGIYQAAIRSSLNGLAAAKHAKYYEINRLGFPVNSASFRP
jgi:hypothetical protein